MLKSIHELVADRYGSKRGFLRHWRHHPLWYRPRWAKASAGTFAPRRLVFICQGNICRSAMAAAVAEQLGMRAVSYGLDTSDGKMAEPRMIAAARELGHELSSHRASCISRYVPQQGDLVCFMEPAHQAAFLRSGHAGPASCLLGQWHPHPRNYIHDPLCCGDAYMRHCATFIEESVRALVERTAVMHNSAGRAARNG